MQIVKFRPDAEEGLNEMEAMRGVNRNVVIGEALDWYLRTLREWYEGHGVLFQRGDVITEVRPPEPGKRWISAGGAPTSAATDEPR